MNPRLSAALLALILAISFALKLRHLDHPALKPLDEVFHAIVARNLLKHPLTPTLNDPQWLNRDENNWLENHIWLHKPPMALWQIAISYAFIGVTPLALRLPSAILSTLAAWITYLIGVRLLNRRAALIAAALQAFNPVILMLVNGYVFSDHVDISLLFWTELSIYLLIRAIQIPNLKISTTEITEKFKNPQSLSPAFLRVLCDLCGKNLFAFSAGIVQGLAFLSKTYPALIVTILALAAVKKLRPRNFLIFLAATILTIAPWLLSTAIRFPHQFAHENLQILHHLNENIESWAAPWDQVVFYYWISIFHVYYPAVLAAIVVIAFRCWRERNLRYAFLLLWFLGVAIPNLLATSKPMSATLIGWPAAWLIFGALISRALAGDILCLGAWLAATFLPILLLREKSIPFGGENWNRADLPPLTILREHLPIVYQTLAAIAVGFLMYSLFSHSPGTLGEGRGEGLLRKPRKLLTCIAIFCTILLAFSAGIGKHRPGYLPVAFRVTSINASEPNFTALAEFAPRLPANASILVDEHTRLENKLVQFAVDRTCYPATKETWPALARALERAGAIPYLLTPVTLPLPVVFADPSQNITLYSCATAP